MLFNPHSLDWLGDQCRQAIVFFVLTFSFAPSFLFAAPVLPELTTDTKLASAGYYQMSWQSGPAGSSHKALLFELQQSHDVNFKFTKIIYRGTDRASVISGQPDGVYFYRVRVISPQQVTGGWSQPVAVTVKHHSLKKALVFFISGAGVFLMTLFFIVFKSRLLRVT